MSTVAQSALVSRSRQAAGKVRDAFRLIIGLITHFNVAVDPDTSALACCLLLTAEGRRQAEEKWR